MEVPTIHLGGVFQGAKSGQVVPTPKASAEVHVTTEVKAPVKVAKAQADNPVYEAVKQAAEAVRSNIYAVSDVRFTIFKDIAGDYVTRFTSLRDGSVKYYPQKSLFEMVKIRNSEIDAMIDAQA